MDYELVQNAKNYIETKINLKPSVGIILGSGLGNLGEDITDKTIIPYSEIEGFPVSDVKGHAAQLVFGKIGDVNVVAMQGRFHYYEGFTMQELTFPIYVLKALGISTLIVTNACGGVNEKLSPGDLMLITDHINFTGNNPLIGPNDERFGPRFPDMTEAYNHKLTDLAKSVAQKLSIKVQEGVYALYTGPSFETAAEIRAFKALGADAVGMSTVPEVIVANYLGLKVLGVSCITNMATGIAKKEHSHEDVLAVAEASGKNFCALVENLVKELKE